MLMQALLFADDQGNTEVQLKNKAIQVRVKEEQMNSYTWPEKEIFSIMESMIHFYIFRAIDPSVSFDCRKEAYLWVMDDCNGPLTFITCCKAVGLDYVEIRDQYNYSVARWNIYLALKAHFKGTKSSQIVRWLEDENDDSIFSFGSLVKHAALKRHELMNYEYFKKVFRKFIDQDAKGVTTKASEEDDDEDLA